MDLKQIKELMKSMQGTGTKRLEITTQDGFKLLLEQNEEARPYNTPIPSDNEFFKQELAHRNDPLLPRKTAAAVESLPFSEDLAVATATSKFITSPMVGTYYAAPSPEMADFTKVGDKVDEKTVVCIIEAMKVMNEVKAGQAGVVAEILVENGQPIEFGTKLFRLT